MKNRDSATRRIKIAGIDNPSGKDLTQVDDQSEFSREIHRLFTEIRPQKIIETGTYHGSGTTRIIAGALKDSGVENSTFYSIEIDPRNCIIAAENLRAAGLLEYVRIVNGVSIPRKELPSREEIQDYTVDNIEFDDIFVDHQASERALLYYQETAFDDVPDDLLGNCLKEFDHRPDFVLLDSGGHIGYAEFVYLIGKISASAYIALDDIFHIKHRKSFELVKSDPRFDIRVTSGEKFGFCIARFNPEA